MSNFTRSADPLLVSCPACGASNRVPRQKIAPVIDELAAEMVGRLRFAKLDVVVGVVSRAEIIRRLDRVVAG